MTASDSVIGNLSSKVAAFPAMRILFVDDESNVLEATRRSLHHMRGDWRMEFVSSGMAALESLAREPVDVLVSDMRMPGMDGWQLLAEAKRRHPEVIRLILSGYADPTSTMRSIGTAHQYLGKPCESASLKAAISKALLLRTMLSSPHLATLAGDIELLPSPPQAFQEILTCLQQPDVTIADAARIIGRDLAMTANILKLVNSAFFGTKQRIARVDRAVSYLGLDTIGALVLGHSIFNQHEVSRTRGAIGHLWQHSLQTAAAASAIALCELYSSTVAEEAFLAGLLHDVGKLVFAMRSLNPLGDADSLYAEEDIELQHAELGAYLLGLWGFPTSIVEAVAFHHTPSRSSDQGLGLAGIVHLANSFSYGQEAAGMGCLALLEPGYLEHRGLADRLPAWRAAIGTLRLGEALS
jgi:putative nucleotidyltransferase with HDIG domain